jgi:hypothetical protein
MAGLRHVANGEIGRDDMLIQAQMDHMMMLT